MLKVTSMVSSFVVSSLAYAGDFDHRPVQAQVEAALATRADASLAATALDAMLDLAEDELRAEGHLSAAARLAARDQETEGMGDHVPQSAWIAEQYAVIESLLGVDVMESTRLRDIWVLNHSIPVVFEPQESAQWCAEQLAGYPGDTCGDEYRRHFAGTKYAAEPDQYAGAAEPHHGFAGVVTYWSVWAACRQITAGTMLKAVCGQAGRVAEYGVERYVAPRLAEERWQRSNTL